MIMDHYAKLLHLASEAQRRHGTESHRQGTVSKVEEKDGERKALVIWGHDPDGKPLTVWASSQEQRSGNDRSQDSIKPGQNVVLQGAGLRQATFTAQGEAKHAPQPKHAPETNGHSRSIGKNLRLAMHGGQEEEEQQQGSQGDKGGSSGGGQQQQKGEKDPYSAQWFAEEDEKLEKWGGPEQKTFSGSGAGSGFGGGSQMAGLEKPQEKQGEQKEEKRAMQQVMHKKEGFTNVIGKGESAVRSAVHPKGSKMVAGKDNFLVLEKDKKALFQGKDDVHVRSEDKNLNAYAKENPYVNKPWVIKEKKEKDPIPNHDLAGKSGGSGGGGGGGGASA